MSEEQVTSAHALGRDLLTTRGVLPLVIETPQGHDITALLGEIRMLIETHLFRQGALLFRGFPIASRLEFESFVKALSPQLLDYDFGSTPRTQLGGKIYTSTEYPAHQSIPLHNEMAYTLDWPMKLWFFCAKAAEEGGYTPIADSREVLKRLDAGIKQRFLDKQVMYVRNYGNGLDLPWQTVFNTAERSAVEAYCREANIAFEWKDDNELRTWQVCQAIAVHPHTGELVWFNQAHLFHISNLEPRVRDALLAVVKEGDLPRNAYYGDGTPIESAVLDEIRAVYTSLTIEFPWQAGDVLMVDNMLVAHGRTPYKGERKILVAMAEPYSQATGSR
jgi:alpha-ketoglutarate-dependent taurine dioxygenase